MTINLLLSYAFHPDTDLADVRTRLRCGELMIDSGAFTAHTLGRTVNLDAYAEYLTRWAGCWTHAITLDVIGDPAGSRRNTRLLLDRGLDVMPVFTRGEKVAEFDAMVTECGYVAVGGGIGMAVAAMLTRLRALQRRAQDLGGGIHALGIGPLRIQQAHPFSGDSSTAGISFKFGRIQAFDGQMRSIQVTNRTGLLKYRQVLVDHGVDVTPMAVTGRTPTGAGLQALRETNHLADFCADEWLRSLYPVLPPRLGWQAGPHLYCAIGNGILGAVLNVDGRIHDGNFRPPVLARYGSKHVCRERVAA
jgi:hypothetical protein